MTKHVTDDIKYKMHFLGARPPTHIKLVFTDKTNANGKDIVLHATLKHFVLLFDMENNTKTDVQIKRPNTKDVFIIIKSISLC